MFLLLPVLSHFCDCQLAANIAKNGKTIASVASGQILGEISFLRNSAATADVIADGSAEEDGEVDVHVIPSERLRLLFVQQPSLAGKVHFCLLLPLCLIFI